MLDVCEIFKSIQGESTFAGEVCSFVRLAGCNIECSYCDTSYARQPGKSMTVEEVCKIVQSYGSFFVEVTGGEPLLQKETPQLCEQLLEMGNTVLVETNGTLDISILPRAAIRIMDVKCPSSGVSDKFLQSNIEALRPTDQCKFVISDRADFDWARNFISANALFDRSVILFSPNMKLCPPGTLADWIISEKLPVRLGLQLHKFIWGPDAKGV
jgi:7-carboxy-7-deazaguanine synthase